MVPVILAALLLILDQITKFIATRFVTINTGVKTLIPGVLQMVNVRNDGSALAFITGNKTVLLAILGVLTVLVLILVWKVVKGGFARTSLLILLAGVLGNGLDRALFGYVTDMFELLFLPNIIFNLADVLMGIGAIFFALSLLFSRGRDDDDEEDEDEDEEDEDDEDERPRRRLFGKRRDDEDDEDEDDDEDDEDERPRRRLFGKRRDDEDDEDDEDDDEDERPVRRNAVAAKAAPVKKPVASASVRTAPAQTQRAAAPAQTQRSAAPAQRAAVTQAQRPVAAQTQRTAATAQRTAATAPAQAQRPAAPVQRAAAPVQRTAPVQKAAAPAPKQAVVEEEFDLDSILNEFK